MKLYSFLSEAIDTDNSYNDALKIFNTLSDNEKWLLCPRHGIYKNVPLIYRHVIKRKGFVDIYHHNHSDKIGFLLIAVAPKYRGQGITHQLLNQCIKDCKELGLTKIWWVCNVDNSNSYHAALKNGFKLQKRGKTEIRLYKEL